MKCPNCGSDQGYYSTFTTKGTQYYDCEGNPTGYNSDVETESKTIRCVDCGKRFSKEKIF